MESDSFFWLLLKQLPETLFALLGLPAATATAYRFEAVEVKKSYRHDGVFIPSTRDLPLYFVEAQFRRDRRFYANLFAKVNSFLEKNDVNQDWQAVVLFENRRAEPKKQRSCDVLIASRHLRRIYLDELAVADTATPGLKLLRLVSIPRRKAPELVAQLLRESRQDADCEHGRIILVLCQS